jgi:hypothetical protein
VQSKLERLSPWARASLLLVRRARCHMRCGASIRGTRSAL